MGGGGGGERDGADLALHAVATHHHHYLLQARELHKYSTPPNTKNLTLGIACKSMQLWLIIHSDKRKLLNATKKMSVRCQPNQHLGFQQGAQLQAAQGEHSQPPRAFETADCTNVAQTSSSLSGLLVHTRQLSIPAGASDELSLCKLQLTLAFCDPCSFQSQHTRALQALVLLLQ